VGDPLLAVYCRAYLARSGAQVAASLTDNAHLMSALSDYLFSMPEYRAQRKRVPRAPLPPAASRAGAAASRAGAAAFLRLAHSAAAAATAAGCRVA